MTLWGILLWIYAVFLARKLVDLVILCSISSPAFRVPSIYWEAWLFGGHDFHLLFNFLAANLLLYLLLFWNQTDRGKTYERGCYGEEKDPVRGSCSCTNDDEVGGAFNVDMTLWEKNKGRCILWNPSFSWSFLIPGWEIMDSFLFVVFG